MFNEDIGINAGGIWSLLSEKGRLSISAIVEYTNYKGEQVLLALGWLAREGKVQFTTIENIVYIELSQSTSNIYYS